jgi:hypothetical protein
VGNGIREGNGTDGTLEIADDFGAPVIETKSGFDARYEDVLILPE